jgi:hypothetical protein
VLVAYGDPAPLTAQPACGVDRLRLYRVTAIVWQIMTAEDDRDWYIVLLIRWTAAA